MSFTTTLKKRVKTGGFCSQKKGEEFLLNQYSHLERGMLLLFSYIYLTSQIIDHAFDQFTIVSEFFSNPHFTLSSDSFIQI